MPAYCKILDIANFNKSPIETGYALLFLSTQNQQLVLKAKTQTGQFITITDKLVIDTVLSALSTNAVTNKAITQGIQAAKQQAVTDSWDKVLQNTDSLLSQTGTGYLTNQTITKGVNKKVSQLKTWILQTYTIQDNVTETGLGLVVSKDIYAQIQRQIKLASKQLQDQIGSITAGAKKLSQLQDVYVPSTPQNKQPLVYNYNLQKWQAGQLQLNTDRLSDLKDVTLSGAIQDASVLTYSTKDGKWVDKKFTIQGVSSFYDLPQINIDKNTLIQQQTLVFDATSQKWINKNIRYPAIAITQLTDVQVINPEIGNVLVYTQNSLWEPKKFNLTDLNDVHTPAPQDGYVLTYNESRTRWQAKRSQATGSSALSGLSDINITQPVENQSVLSYDSGNKVWINRKLAVSSVSLYAPQSIQQNVHLRVDKLVQNVYTEIVNTATGLNRAAVSITDKAKYTEQAAINWIAFPEVGLNTTQQAVKAVVKLNVSEFQKKQLRYSWFYIQNQKPVYIQWHPFIYPALELGKLDKIKQAADFTQDDIIAIARRMALIFG